MTVRISPYFVTVADGREILFREDLGLVVSAGIVYAARYGGLLLAVCNLAFVRPLPVVSMLASLVWIAFVTAVVVTDCRKNGILGHLIFVVEFLTRNRFVEFSSDSSGDSILGFGFKIGSKRHYFLKLRPEGITEVYWCPCQWNDPRVDNQWDVSIKYDVGAVIQGRKEDRLGFFTVRPCGPKAAREAFGTGFIEFLKANHVQLAPGATAEEG